MKYEIINPSDKAYIEGEPLACALATIFLGKGKYGLKDKDGEMFMPIFIWGGAEEWIRSEFNLALNNKTVDDNLESVINALLTVHLAGERSSMNDIIKTAKQLAKNLSNPKNAKA